MAETLTFEQETEVTSIDSLTEDEKSSLELGEKMQAEQDQLLAGKYKNAEDLETAYIELQKKLGDNKTEPEEDSQDPPESEAKSEEEYVPDTAFLDTLYEEAKSDAPTQETKDKLSKMSPEELADMHLQYRRQIEEGSNTKDLSPEDVKTIKGVAGGEGEYERMISWAQDNLGKQEIDMFDAVMDKGDRLASFFAVRSLAYRYQDAIGVQPDLVTGSAPKSSDSQFRSQQEVVSAMSDPRYENDPAYRQDIMRKLDRSNVKF